jgi:Domain of unknown function (DU1801)
MHPTGGDVEQFLAEIPDEKRRAEARALCSLFSEITGHDPVLWGSSIIGFGTYRYRYESGHEGTSALASFAPRKGNLVIYLIGGFEERHRGLVAKLGPHKTGKGCLYLKRLSDVDLDVLRDLVDRSVQVRRGMDRAAADPISGRGPTSTS